MPKIFRIQLKSLASFHDHLMHIPLNYKCIEFCEKMVFGFAAKCNLVLWKGSFSFRSSPWWALWWRFSGFIVCIHLSMGGRDALERFKHWHSILNCIFIYFFWLFFDSFYFISFSLNLNFLFWFFFVGFVVFGQKQNQQQNSALTLCRKSQWEVRFFSCSFALFRFVSFGSFWVTSKSNRELIWMGQTLKKTNKNSLQNGTHDLLVLLWTQHFAIHIQFDFLCFFFLFSWFCFTLHCRYTVLASDWVAYLKSVKRD